MKYRRARQTAWRTIAGETVLLDLEGKRMYGLNPTAAALWLALETSPGLEALLAAATGGRQASFGADEIATFVAELVELGLAEKRSEEEPPAPVTARESSGAGAELPAELEPPAILWREEVEQIAGTCAFFPSANPLCDQVPFS